MNGIELILPSKICIRTRLKIIRHSGEVSQEHTSNFLKYLCKFRHSSVFQIPSEMQSIIILFLLFFFLTSFWQIALLTISFHIFVVKGVETFFVHAVLRRFQYFLQPWKACRHSKKHHFFFRFWRRYVIKDELFFKKIAIGSAFQIAVYLCSYVLIEASSKRK